MSTSSAASNGCATAADHPRLPLLRLQRSPNQPSAALLPLPSVLRKPFNVSDGPPSSAAGNPGLPPSLYSILNSGARRGPEEGSGFEDWSCTFRRTGTGRAQCDFRIFDYLQECTTGSTMYGFKGGPAGIMNCKYVELTSELSFLSETSTGATLVQGGFHMICSGRDKIETPEQFKQADETASKLELDGLVVIGGDDSNTNACLLAENFRGKKLKTRVIGCPKTIDGDLKCKEVPTSFGFDTACKVMTVPSSAPCVFNSMWFPPLTTIYKILIQIYAEMIGNVMIDARSTGKYYHFVRLMGRAASHITLECALQTHPNITIIGEEVALKKLTLKNVTDYITDIICKRAERGFNYGVVLIPEGLIDFIPEVQQLIGELNEILAHDVVDEGGQWKKKLRNQSQQLFDFLPQAIQEQLLLERDPHGNVQVAKIETEKMLIQMVDTELEKRRQEHSYNGKFNGQSHFFGYEGRCGLPTNFDANYCYALGYGAGALLHSGKTGLISSVGNLGAPVEEWTVGGTALTSLMDVERRHGKFNRDKEGNGGTRRNCFSIAHASTCSSAPFKKFASLRDEWALKNRYVSPGPVQFVGPTANEINHTLMLELGAQA
ncbi:Pyrophosphate--fructose 6-phosphate 1-phosphotransferase subunit beta [Vitis vinifera]|uniref:Pyrophosphate--fructose 6-phosphate 1-phosphotransferase subunit beta n=1 Tax=Vitis vinifera TaxID=29760 RepID=A0A438CJ72_VITVI|nr:Pyrophosphate--fructose 6-phosphate 1-phosphotransferase subunit beta [Vitis vinifera]